MANKNPTWNDILIFDLNEKDLVIDLGAYKGTFIETINNKYSCKILAFEPVKKYYLESIKTEIKGDIKCYNFGLGGSDRVEEIFINGDSSSTIKVGGESERIEIKDMKNFLKENSINEVSLIKLNIEGGEYELLEDIINNDYVNIFRHLVIQFHFLDNSEFLARRDKIRESLSKTHTFKNYNDIFEAWSIIK